MQNKIKLFSKIFFLIVILLMLYNILGLVFKEQLKVIDKNVKVFEVSQEKIISSGQEVIIRSFEDINSVAWSGDDTLMIDGVIDDNRALYQFNMIEKALVLNPSKNDTHGSYGSYTFIKNIPGYGDLCTIDSKIGLLNNGDFKTIAENVSYNGSLKYMVSDNLSKLVYYHHEKNTLVSYSFEKDFYRTINVTLSDAAKEHFMTMVQISPLAGYVSVETKDTVTEEANFSIFGADSGKLYAKEVFGTHLSWSPEDDYVCYYYSKESELMDPNVIDGFEIKSKRIGYYDVVNKDIKYLDSSSSEKDMLSKIYWSGKTITTITGRVEEQIQFESLLSYNFENNTFNEWSLDTITIEVGAKVELIDYDDEFILSIQSQSDHKLLRILKDSKEVTKYEGLIPFDTLDQEDIYFYSQSGHFITMDIDKMTVSSPGFQGYVYLEDSAFKVLPNPSLKFVAVWLTKKSEIKILELK